MHHQSLKHLPWFAKLGLVLLALAGFAFTLIADLSRDWWIGGFGRTSSPGPDADEFASLVAGVTWLLILPGCAMSLPSRIRSRFIAFAVGVGGWMLISAMFAPIPPSSGLWRASLVAPGLAMIAVSASRRFARPEDEH